MNPVYKTLRALAWALYFNLGASLISMTQVLSLPLAVIAPGVYRRHINRTEGHFGAFLLKMNQLFAPSDIVLTGDESIRGIVKRMIFISNHQIYSDWMYLWCFSYFAEKHRALKIILRGDLTWIPVFGWYRFLFSFFGMRFFDFILLKRNDWAHDKRAIEENLDRVNAKDPLWLVVFPEGTVVSRGTRKRSTAFAEKAGLADHRHVLLPRTSGLFVCINKLRGSVEYLYDATVGYSGIAYGEIPQELYPLPGLYLNQAQPKDINMHLRRFAIKEIPETEPEFVEWVRQRWQEKDELMEEFYTTGKFPSQLTLEDIGGGVGDEKKEVVKKKGGESVRIPLKSRAMLDYLSPSALNVIALPVLAFAIRYALQHSS
ncbi:MAG: acyltransferase-domain-containing protein [Linnemannia elongata]|nr:MAG: acyltransferase-domain-containing protein [Linnemannia elongata]